MEGTIRSCFGLTEPAVASSDARNIACSALKSGDGKYYIVNDGNGGLQMQCIRAAKYVY